MSTVIGRIEAYLDARSQLGRPFDQSVIHNANGVELQTLDLLTVLELAKQAAPAEPESVSLLDGEGDWWIWINEDWIHLGNRPRRMAQQAFDAEQGWARPRSRWTGETLDEGVDRIARLFVGVRA